jgi:hypothetical protein
MLNLQAITNLCLQHLIASQQTLQVFSKLMSVYYVWNQNELKLTSTFNQSDTNIFWTFLSAKTDKHKSTFDKVKISSASKHKGTNH